jgi:hypothetical protein
MTSLQLVVLETSVQSVILKKTLDRQPYLHNVQALLRPRHHDEEQP